MKKIRDATGFFAIVFLALIICGAIKGNTAAWISGLVLLIIDIVVGISIQYYINITQRKTTKVLPLEAEKKLFEQKSIPKSCTEIGLGENHVIKLGEEETIHSALSKEEKSQSQEMSAHISELIERSIREAYYKNYFDKEEYVEEIYNMWLAHADAAVEKRQCGNITYCVLHVQSNYLWDIVAEVTYDFVKVYALFFEADVSKEGLFDQINKWNQANVSVKFLIVGDRCLAVKNIPILPKTEVAKLSWKCSLEITKILDETFPSASSFIKR